MSKRGRRRGAAPAATTAKPKARAFWGKPDKRSATTKPIRPTPDPAALLRSLGNPPLAPATAAQHLAIVYEEAVRAATALAAANGLLDDESST